MADRFSRFNEDRDFQVNTGVAEHPGRRWPSRDLLTPRSQLFSFRLRSGLRTGSLCSRLPILQGASQLEARPRLLSLLILSPVQLRPRVCGFGLLGRVSEARPPTGVCAPLGSARPAEATGGLPGGKEGWVGRASGGCC